MRKVRIGLIGTGYRPLSCHCLRAGHDCFSTQGAASIRDVGRSHPELAQQRAAEFGFSDSPLIGANWLPILILMWWIFVHQISCIRRWLWRQLAMANMFIQKAVTLSAADAKEMVDAARAKGRTTLVGFTI